MTEERKELDKAELQRAEAAGNKLGEAEKAGLIAYRGKRGRRHE